MISVNFTDLNKACLEDSFLLARIDLIMDIIVGHNLLSFLDVFSSYN